MRRSTFAWVGAALLLGACFGGGGGSGPSAVLGQGDAGAVTGPADGGDSDQGRAAGGSAGSAADAGGASGASGASGEGGEGGASGVGGSGVRGDMEPLPLVAGDVEKVDVLFVVDNSGSMREEQAALRDQFPAMIDALVAGGAEDLHLGVVSSDMGLVGIPGIPGCDGLGDDGIMNLVPDLSVGGCQASYPRFLTHVVGIDDPAVTANDLACVATLGVVGCGFEQQLESGLKALWPSIDVDLRTGEVYEPNRVTFLGDSNGFGQVGHGDLENAGFLRNDLVTGLSVLAVVIVTDEEDCSSRDTRHFLPDVFLDPSIPEQAALAMQDLNLRCHFNEQNLYKLTRYAPTMEGEPLHPFPGAFQALRPGAEQLVIFAIIAGVPVDLIDPDLDLDDATARDAYYEDMLDDPRMLPAIDTALPPGEGNLIPSCESDLDGDGVRESRAFPPRRLIEVARRFGNRGVVGSICQEIDLSPVTDLINDVLADPSPR